MSSIGLNFSSYLLHEFLQTKCSKSSGSHDRNMINYTAGANYEVYINAKQWNDTVMDKYWG